jgi:hypothetical protein
MEKGATMAINFNDRVLVTNPTTHYLGRGVLAVAIIAIITGIITHFTGDVLLPAPIWCVFGVPTGFIGWVFMKSGLTKN